MPHTSSPPTIVTADFFTAALELITRHEGFRQFPYPDAKNTIAIGYGTNLTDRGITTTEALLFVRSDITKSVVRLSTQSWWKCLNTARQCAILDIAYAVGDDGLLEFHRMIDDIGRMDFISAAAEIMHSKFAQEDKARAAEDAQIMWHGAFKGVANE
jgi:lysozyme